MDIFNRKKVKALEIKVAELNEIAKSADKIIGDYINKLDTVKKDSADANKYLEDKIVHLLREASDSHKEIADLKNKLVIATRLNEIYAAKPSTEALEKAIKKNGETINEYIKREQAYIKRIDELEKREDRPVEDYNYGGKIPTRDPKTGRFMKS